ncbi:TVP38/TMEM64 family protein [Bombella apis]|uniref:TVP38/TMEM64 family protein n=1 Tax=Bombella apis TaxID=1785988 RepID=UPI0024A92FE1|nr:VTT domain-containing protein [Bombella apis]
MRAAVRPALLALLLVGGPLLLWRIPASQHGLGLMREWAGQPYAALRVLPLAVLYCAFGLPRQALCFVLGAGFGVGIGVVEASLAYGAGALLGYGWGRLWRWKCPVRAASVPWFIRAGQRAPFRMVACARLLPVGSALLVSVSSGMAGLAVGRFLLATMLGGLPQNLVFLLAGRGVELRHGWALVTAAVLALLSAVLGGWVLRGFHKEMRWERQDSGA